MDARTVQIRRRGVITIPAELRRQYDLDEGETLTLVDLGDGALLFTPQISRTGRMGDKVAQLMEQEGVSVEEVLQALDEERESYYREHYAQT